MLIHSDRRTQRATARVVGAILAGVPPPLYAGQLSVDGLQSWRTVAVGNDPRQVRTRTERVAWRYYRRHYRNPWARVVPAGER